MPAKRKEGKQVSRRREPNLPHRIVVKFRDGIGLEYGDAAILRKELDRIETWNRLTAKFPGIEMFPLFNSIRPQRLREFIGQAVRRSATYRPPDFTSYFVVRCRFQPAKRRKLLEALRAWKWVTVAYIDPPGSDPAVNANDDPYSGNQCYLNSAPQGIDARYAWSFTGGDGKGQNFIDVERGWTLNHEDLPSGISHIGNWIIADGSRSHGTSVLGIVCMADNNIGGIGIAPNLASTRVVSYNDDYGISDRLNASVFPADRANAILFAAGQLSAGDVLLIEAQIPSIADTNWSLVPIEVLDAEYAAIEFATARGVIVIEPAGNGTNDLDQFCMVSGGPKILRRGDPAFRDSGAIMVAASGAAIPHARWNDPIVTNWGTNFGCRVDCYAWGEHVFTATSKMQNGGFTTNSYGEFGGSSSAAAIIAGAALVVQGLMHAKLNVRLGPAQMRAVLKDPATSTASANSNDHIGVMPDLRAIVQAYIQRPSAPMPPPYLEIH